MTISNLRAQTSKTRESMDVFGEALEAYGAGARGKLRFETPSGDLFEHRLRRYFRTASQFSRMELTLISLCRGDILDVGCGTGNYLPLLANAGRVTAIDISPKIIRIAEKNGRANCRVADIFAFPENKKFDTITLLGNNLGMGGTAERTRRLLRKLSRVLKRDGQILGLLRNLRDRDYLEVKLRPSWKGKVGPWFKWIHMNVRFLSDLGEKEGLRLETLQGNRHVRLVRLAKE